MSETMIEVVEALHAINETLRRIEAKMEDCVVSLAELEKGNVRICDRLGRPKVEIKKRPAHLRSVRLDDERIET